MNKLLLLAIGAVALAVFATGCATGAHVDTPIVDVGAGASLD